MCPPRNASRPSRFPTKKHAWCNASEHKPTQRAREGSQGCGRGFPQSCPSFWGGKGALSSSSRVRQSQLGWCFPYGGTIWRLHLVTRSARQDRLRISHPCVHRGEKPQESYIQVSNTLSRSQRQAKCLLSLPALATLVAQSPSEGPGAEVQVLPCLGQTYKKFVTRKMFHCAIS